MTVIQTLRTHPRVKFADDERDCGNGVIITLKRGWSFDTLSDNRVCGADTLTQALAMVRRSAVPFAGPYEP